MKKVVKPFILTTFFIENSRFYNWILTLQRRHLAAILDYETNVEFSFLKEPKKLCCNGIICLVMNSMSCRFTRMGMRHLWLSILLRLLRMIHWLRFLFKICKLVRLTLFWAIGNVQFYFYFDSKNHFCDFFLAIFENIGICFSRQKLIIMEHYHFGAKIQILLWCYQ